MFDTLKKNAELSGKFHKASDLGDGVLLVCFDRPPMNSFHEAMWTELSSTFKTISKTPSVRVVVLSSTSEKAFTLGLDVPSELKSIQGNANAEPSRRAFALHQHLREFQDCISEIEKCNQPVIAAISGICVGLGVDITSACDIRLCSEATRFGIVEINVGLAADIGTLQRFPKIVSSSSTARELALTGRIFSPQEAKEIGFVSKVVPGGLKEVITEAGKMAAVIARKSPIAVVGVKKLMNHARDHTVQEGLEYTAAWNMSMLLSDDTMSSMQNLGKKQQLTFPDIGVNSVKAKL